MAVKEVSRGKVHKETEEASPSVAERTLAAANEIPEEKLREAPVGTTRYWLGTLDQCPLQNVSLAGRTLHRWTYRQFWIEGQRLPEKIQRRGGIEDLTDEQFEAIKAASMKKFVRRTGDRAEVVSKREGRPHFQSDEPIGTYVYCLPIDEAAKLLGPSWQDQGTPPPLISPRG